MQMSWHRPWWVVYVQTICGRVWNNCCSLSNTCVNFTLDFTSSQSTGMSTCHDCNVCGKSFKRLESHLSQNLACKSHYMSRVNAAAAAPTIPNDADVNTGHEVSSQGSSPTLRSGKSYSKSPWPSSLQPSSRSSSLQPYLPPSSSQPSSQPSHSSQRSPSRQSLCPQQSRRVDWATSGSHMLPGRECRSMPVPTSQQPLMVVASAYFATNTVNTQSWRGPSVCCKVSENNPTATWCCSKEPTQAKSTSSKCSVIRLWFLVVNMHTKPAKWSSIHCCNAYVTHI